MSKEQHKAIAQNGWKLVNNTNAHTDAHYGICVREDTVISAWTAKDGTIDLVDHFNISGETLTDKDLALLIPDAWIKEGAQSITLSSGSINLLLA